MAMMICSPLGALHSAVAGWEQVLCEQRQVVQQCEYRRADLAHSFVRE